MVVALKHGWSKPSTILFASEYPPEEKTFAFALAEAVRFGADLIIFHVYDGSDRVASKASNSCDYATANTKKRLFEPFAERAKEIGVYCRIVVRAGAAADQILAFMDQRRVDRVVMGTHSPGPIGKLLVGSVTEAVLREANIPVCIVGPNVVEGTFRNANERKILCDVSKQEVSKVVAYFGAELAAEHNASLVLQQIIPPQERAAFMADMTIGQIEAELPTLVPARLLRRVKVQTRVTLGDPIEELLYQGRSMQANLIVLGAHGASHFAAITGAAIVYKVLAFAHCPVITLSPVVLAKCVTQAETFEQPEVNFIAGVL